MITCIQLWWPGCFNRSGEGMEILLYFIHKPEDPVLVTPIPPVSVLMTMPFVSPMHYPGARHSSYSGQVHFWEPFRHNILFRIYNLVLVLSVFLESANIWFIAIIRADVKMKVLSEDNLLAWPQLRKMCSSFIFHKAVHSVFNQLGGKVNL